MKKISAMVLGLVLLALPVFATINFPLTTPYTGPSFSATFPNAVATEPTSGTAKSLDGTVNSTYTGTFYYATTKNGSAFFGLGVLDYTTETGTSIADLDASVDGGIAGGKETLVPGSRMSATLN